MSIIGLSIPAITAHSFETVANCKVCHTDFQHTTLWYSNHIAIPISAECYECHTVTGDTPETKNCATCHETHENPYCDWVNAHGAIYSCMHCHNNFISGGVTGDVLMYVTINLYKETCGGADLIKTTETDYRGKYCLEKLSDGKFTVEPEYGGADFEPPSFTNIPIPADISVQYNFTSSCGCGGCE